jgi:hypothetical protein
MSRPTARQKKEVARRARNCCEYCRTPLDYSADPFSAEHIIPQVLGGKTDLENLALSCQGCNGRKYTKIESLDPANEKMVPLFHPRQHVWSEHFEWSRDLTQIVGRTPTGRATIHELELNRNGVVNLRRALYAVGEHPALKDDM